MIFSNPASGEGLPSRSSTFAGGAMPAQFTTTRSGPAAAAVSTAAATWSGSVTSAAANAPAELGREVGAGRAGQVDDRDGRAGRGEASGGGESETARATGDEGGGFREVHGFSFERRVRSRCAAALHPTLRGTQCHAVPRPPRRPGRNAYRSQARCSTPARGAPGFTRRDAAAATARARPEIGDTAGARRRPLRDGGMSIPVEPVAVPDRVRELARGARLEPVWRNNNGGLTFRTDDERYIKFGSAQPRVVASRARPGGWSGQGDTSGCRTCSRSAATTPASGW